MLKKLYNVCNPNVIEQNQVIPFLFKFCNIYTDILFVQDHALGLLLLSRLSCRVYPLPRKPPEIQDGVPCLGFTASGYPLL